MERRKLPSAALFLTLFGSAVIMPPLVLLFNIRVRLLGVPLEVLYLFSVWIGLIAITAYLARRLSGVTLSGNTSPNESDN